MFFKLEKYSSCLDFSFWYAHGLFTHVNSYQVNMPSTEDRTLFFTHLVEALLSVFSEGMSKKSQDAGRLSELPKAPKLAAGPKVSELKAKVEAEQHALRRLRMCLRDVCNRYVNS